MSRIDIDVDPCDHITADAIGKPGQRVFYLHAYSDHRTITIITPRPIPLADVSDLLVAVLSMHGLVLEDRGAYSIIREP